MKTMKLKMVSLFLVLGSFSICFNINSQDIKLTRQERQEARKVELTTNFHILDSLLNERSFVLEADYLQNKYGERFPVVSSLNFIKVDKSNGVLQTGSNLSMGDNGVGGITSEGRIGIWKINKNFKNLTYTLKFSLLTNMGNYDIFMSVNSDNNALATISGSGRGKLTWVGHLKTVNNSTVFKGRESL